MKQSSLATQTSYAESVSPQWVSLLDLLAMNVRYERCQGAEMFADDGTCYLDFLSGYCVHNTGHNHPYIVEALKQELDRSGPAMLQSHVPELAGELGQRLCTLAGGKLTFSAAPVARAWKLRLSLRAPLRNATVCSIARGPFMGSPVAPSR